nr:MAG TPA: hypothetical protein [Caudoviricetes sp.]
MSIAYHQHCVLSSIFTNIFDISQSFIVSLELYG